MKIKNNWIDPKVDEKEHMDKIKYPEVTKLVNIFTSNGIEYLFIDTSFIRELTDERYFNDVHIMVREIDYERTLATLFSAGWFPVVDAESGSTRRLTIDEQVEITQPTINMSHYSFVSKDENGPPKECKCPKCGAKVP